MKPYYEADGITIYHGDCREVLADLDVAADLVFTSPPYNLGTTTGGSWGSGSRWAAARGGVRAGYGDASCDALPTAEYEAWQRDVLADLWAHTKPTGAIFYNHKPRVQDKILWTPLDVNPGLPVRQIVIWARAGGINFAPTHYVSTHEWIVVFAGPDFALRDRAASGVGDVWRVPQEPSEHPAPFPLALPLTAIETTGAQLVLDPFMGSGTTLRAAKDLGRRAIGIELEERYCELAAQRLAQMVLDVAA